MDAVTCSLTRSYVYIISLQSWSWPIGAMRRGSVLYRGHTCRYAYAFWESFLRLHYCITAIGQDHCAHGRCTWVKQNAGWKMDSYLTFKKWMNYFKELKTITGWIQSKEHQPAHRDLQGEIFDFSREMFIHPESPARILPSIKLISVSYTVN